MITKNRRLPQGRLAGFRPRPLVVICYLTLLALLACALPAGAAAPDRKLFWPLRQYLLEHGFSRQELNRVFGDPRLRFEARVLARMLSVRETSLNYKQFLAKKVQTQARRFLRKHRGAFVRAKKATRVPPEVVVAILSVETRLGRYTGRHLTFNVLASQAILNTKAARRRLEPYWPAKRRKALYSKKNTKRFAKRARWARQEVAALLKLARQRGVSPFALKGSPAGALGMPQFVPSSILHYGCDGNQDGVVDLGHPEDAIFSVAVYLKQNGWRPGLSHRRQVKVILTYNNSRPYAETVLALARRLR